jgi:hypothetical protein
MLNAFSCLIAPETTDKSLSEPIMTATFFIISPHFFVTVQVVSQNVA